MLLQVRELGSGDPIVVLGGSWSPAEYVLPLAHALATRWRVLVPSFPGYDGSPRFSGSWSWGVDRELLENTLLEHAGSDVVAAIGSSLGGYRALALACAGRVRVRSVVSIAGFAELSQAERTGMRGMAAAVRAGALPPSALSQAALSPRYAASHAAVAKAVDAWTGRVDLASVASEYDALSECPDLVPEVARLHVPTLVRVGDADTAVPPGHAEGIFSAAPKATLERVPGAGHMLLLEDAEATTRSVLTFVAANAAEATAATSLRS